MFFPRTLTPFLGLLVATALPAADRPDAERPGPPHPPAPEKLFEHFDTDHDQALSRQEFIRGMAELAQRRAERKDGGERRPPGEAGDGDHPPRPPKDGERPPHPPGDGERPPHPPKDGERPPRPPGDGEGRPPHGDGEHPLENAFTKADVDKNGTLSLDEFRAALENMPHPGQRPPPREGEPQPERPRPPKDN